jgi:hypothetical protein
MKEKDGVFIVVESEKTTFGDLSAAWMINVLERNGIEVEIIGDVLGQEVVIIKNRAGTLIFLEILRDKRAVAMVQYLPLATGADLNNIDFMNEINEANRKAVTVKFTADTNVLSMIVYSVIFFSDVISESRLIEAIDRHWADFVTVLTSTNIRSFIK